MEKNVDDETNSAVPKNECPQCKSVYSSYSNLRKHVKKFHPGQETELAPPLRYKIPSNFKFSCANCGRNFNYERHIRHHMKTRHKADVADKTPRKPKKCPLCKYEDCFKVDLISHFEQVHDVVIHKRNVKVASADFQQWKNDLECNTNTRFIKEYVRKSKNDVALESYICHRSGVYVPEGKGLRHLKTQGSTKINAFCPASIKVRREKLECQVQIIETHVGHECDFDHLWLTKAERDVIAKKIAAKVPFDHILDEIRGSVSDSASQRIHFLTRKDLHNIKNSLNLRRSSVQHSSDDINENQIQIYLDVPSDEEPDEINASFTKSIKTESSPELVNKEYGTIEMSTLDLIKEKEELKNHFIRLVDNATSFSELEIIKRMIVPISPVPTLIDANSISQLPKPDEKVSQNGFPTLMSKRGFRQKKRLLKTKSKMKHLSEVSLDLDSN